MPSNHGRGASANRARCRSMAIGCHRAGPPTGQTFSTSSAAGFTSAARSAATSPHHIGQSPFQESPTFGHANCRPSHWRALLTMVNVRVTVLRTPWCTTLRAAGDTMHRRTQSYREWPPGFAMRGTSVTQEEAMAGSVTQEIDQIFRHVVACRGRLGTVLRCSACRSNN